MSKKMSNPPPPVIRPKVQQGTPPGPTPAPQARPQPVPRPRKIAIPIKEVSVFIDNENSIGLSTEWDRFKDCLIVVDPSAPATWNVYSKEGYPLETLSAGNFPFTVKYAYIAELAADIRAEIEAHKQNTPKTP